MTERLDSCIRQSGMDCSSGCEVVREIAINVQSRSNQPMRDSILEVTNKRCPEGTKFHYTGNILELVEGTEKIIQLRPTNGQLSANREASEGSAAGL